MNDQLLRIGDYYWRTESRSITSSNSADTEQYITLSKKQHQLLQCLVSAAPRILQHDEIIEYAWQSRPASIESLTQLISRTRQLIKDSDKTILVNQPGQGYTLLFTVIDESVSTTLSKADEDVQTPKHDESIANTSQHHSISRKDKRYLWIMGILAMSALVLSGKTMEAMYHKHLFNKMLQAKPYPHILAEKVNGKTTLSIGQHTCIYEPNSQRLRCK